MGEAAEKIYVFPTLVENIVDNVDGMPEDACCRNCHFNRPQGKNAGIKCRRFPNEVTKEPEDWCGEWKAKS